MNYTGFKTLDILTVGLQNSEHIVIASRPGMGKMAFALNIALDAAVRQNITVGIFSLGMSERQ